MCGVGELEARGLVWHSHFATVFSVLQGVFVFSVARRKICCTVAHGFLESLSARSSPTRQASGVEFRRSN